jgi:hypothetical protein
MKPVDKKKEKRMLDNIKKSRNTMKKALYGEDLRRCYIANIAMLLHDRYGITDVKKRNQAAEDILKLIFD